MEYQQTAEGIVKKKIMNKTSRQLKKYIPDISILMGVYIFSYNLLRPTEIINLDRDFTGGKVLGLMLVVLGADIAIRFYFNKKNENKS